MSRPAAVEVFAAFARAMREHGGRWYVYGGQAVLAYGRPRLTMDVDITVDLSGKTPLSLLTTLAGHGIEARFALSEAFLADLRLVPMVHTATGIPIDLVIAGRGLDEDLLARAVAKDIEGVEVPFISVEDLVALKILAGRRKDVDDVRGVLAAQHGKIDFARIREVLVAFEEALGKRRLVEKLDRLLRRDRPPGSVGPRRGRGGSR